MKKSVEKNGKIQCENFAFLTWKIRVNHAVFHKHFEQKKIMAKTPKNAIMSIIVYIIFPSKKQGEK